MGKSCNKISGASATTNLKEFVVDESFDKISDRQNTSVIFILLPYIYCGIRWDRVLTL